MRKGGGAREVWEKAAKGEGSKGGARTRGEDVVRAQARGGRRVVKEWGTAPFWCSGVTQPPAAWDIAAAAKDRSAQGGADRTPTRRHPPYDRCFGISRHHLQPVLNRCPNPII